MPLLRVEGQEVGIFESAVINELIDEFSPGTSMLPNNPIAKARSRAWIEFGSSCLSDMSSIATGATEEKHRQGIQDLSGKLAKLETLTNPAPFFNGAELSLVDTAFAPLFQRLTVLESGGELLPWAKLPKVRAWADALMTHPAVVASLPKGATKMYRGYVMKRNGYLGQKLAQD